MARYWKTSSTEESIPVTSQDGNFETTGFQTSSLKCRSIGIVAASMCAITLFLGFSSTVPTQRAPLEGSKPPPPPHVGDYCDTDPLYSKQTLKPLVDAPVASLLVSSKLKGQRKFEASDVLVKDGYYYAICDSSWAIIKVRQDMPMLSGDNFHIGDPEDSNGNPESDFEAIFEDRLNGQLYIVREAIDVSGGFPPSEQVASDHRRLDVSMARRELKPPPATDDPNYHAIIMQVDIFDDDSGYRVTEQCPSEMSFPSASKGFEGAASLRGKDGLLYVLGLCEGNHCQDGSTGRDAGNGQIVVMTKAAGDAVPGFDCYWKTVTTLAIPRTGANFLDYSAISLHPSTKMVAISSQENSQVWVGKLHGGTDGEFDPATASFHDDIATVYDFPRTASGNCEVQYCNVEGLAWVETGGNLGDDGDGETADTPMVLVAVSDKMKSHGRQPNECFAKDQSFHLFALP